jgi:hypothetical protein
MENECEIIINAEIDVEDYIQLRRFPFTKGIISKQNQKD